MPRGGPRPNSGGARPGAGRKPKPPVVAVIDDPQKFLMDVMQGLIVPSSAQLAAAKSLFAAAARGKKDEAGVRAKKASEGKFAASAPPLRIVSNG